MKVKIELCHADRERARAIFGESKRNEKNQKDTEFDRINLVKGSTPSVTWGKPG
jgi:hypothetical protein